MTVMRHPASVQCSSYVAPPCDVIDRSNHQIMIKAFGGRRNDEMELFCMFALFDEANAAVTTFSIADAIKCSRRSHEEMLRVIIQSFQDGEHNECERVCWSVAYTQQ